MSDRIYNSEQELIKHALKLHGKSLYEIHGDKSKIKFKGKGGFGNKVEKVHYEIENNNRPGPDVENLGIEIKTNPLERNRNGIVPGERISLSMINFDEIIIEKFESSSFLRKNKKILFNMFLREKNLLEHERKFLLIDLFKLKGNDLEVIKKDWHYIKKMASSLKANNIHEGDTNYLGAVTKGGKNQKLMPYCNGKASAKRRAYSLKPAFIRNLLANYELVNKSGVVLLVKKKKTKTSYVILEKRHNGSIEEATLEKFNNYLGFSDSTISEKFDFQQSFIDKKDKARWHWLTSYMLIGTRKKFLSREIEEFSKSGLTVKTIRVDTKNLPVEEISFRTINYENLENKVWEESSLYGEMSSKFLWVVYKIIEDKTILDKVFFWSMPLEDLDFIKKKWMKFTELLRAKDYRSSYFMDDDSFYYLKIKDNKGGANKEFGSSNVTSLSHWFRKSYVQNIITN
jgi:DNA mismatch repair protein MutH